MVDRGHYFALDGGLSYKKILNHFRDQANGKTVLMPSKQFNQDKRKSRNKNQLILIDLADPPKVEQKNNETMPKVDVIDPLEADRKRAIDELQREVAENKKSEKPPKRRKQVSASHSKKQSWKNNTSRRQRRGAVQAIVKRTRDIFD